MNSAPIDALGKIAPTVRGQVQVAPKPESAANAPTTAFSQIEREADRIVVSVSPEGLAKNIQMQQQTGSNSRRSSSPVEEVGERVREIIQELESRATSVQFAIEEGNGDILIQVVNRASGEIVRQIPPEEILNLQDKLRDLNGLLFDKVS